MHMKLLQSELNRRMHAWRRLNKDLVAFDFIGVDTMVVDGGSWETFLCFWNELLNNINVSRWSRTCTWKTTLLQYRLQRYFTCTKNTRELRKSMLIFTESYAIAVQRILKPRNYYGYKYMHVFANAWRNRSLRIKFHFLEYLWFREKHINVNFRSHFRKILTNLNKVRQCSYWSTSITLDSLALYRSQYLETHFPVPLLSFMVHSHCPTPRPIKCLQNPKEIYISLCLSAVWTPPYNSMQAIFYRSLSRCLPV